MPETNVSSVSSGHYADMQTSVSSVPGNKVLLDNISNVYNYKDIIQFPMSFLRKYENIIKTNLVDYKIDKSRYYRPEYVSWDLYGTTDLWYLILFVNDLKSPMELNYEDIKVPNSLYALEIINKLKNIDKIKSTHQNPTYIYQSLLKDINSPSEKIKDEDNSFVSNPSITFEDKLDEFKNTYFDIQLGKLRRDTYFSVVTGKATNSPNNFGFVPGLDFYKVLSSNHPEEMKLTKMLKNNTTYYLFKRYVGEMDFTILSNDDIFKNAYHRDILTNEKVEMTPAILTYDLREATLAPEFLKENLVLKLDDKTYEPEIITNSDNEECYGIVINKNKYEIFFDGTIYYIILSEDLKKNEKEIAVLENKDYDNKGNQLNTYHSINQWIFNDSNSPLVKIDEDSESSDLYFNEDYYYKYGEYVYSMKYTSDSLKQMRKDGVDNNITLRIDINRDLKTNINKLSRYQFLGFEFETGLSYSNSNITENEIHDDIEMNLGITDGIEYSPLTITIVTNELDENNENIKYTFSYPNGIIPNDEINIDKTYKNFLQLYIDKLNNSDDLQFDLYKYKRIVPIINNFKDKELLDIKEILVSTKFKLNDDIADKDVNFTGEFTISCGKLKIFGLRYDDLVTEFVTPNVDTDFAEYDLYYTYKTDNTKYSIDSETNYFEPYLFEETDDIINKLSDENALDYTIRNNYSSEKTYYYIQSVYDENEKIYSYHFNLVSMLIMGSGYNPKPIFLDFSKESTCQQFYNNIDYFKYLLKHYENDDNIENIRNAPYFKLSDNYILDFNIENIIADNRNFISESIYTNKYYINDFTDNKVFLNGYGTNATISEVLTNRNNFIFHNNYQFCFDVLDKNYYMINLGELKYLTNNSTFKKDSTKEYENTNLYLKNFKSYPFAVDINDNGGNKDFYSKFKNLYISEDSTKKNRSIINLKLNNETYSIPGGLYKVFNSEGVNSYQPYTYIDYFRYNVYPILQTKIFSNNYIDSVQNKVTFDDTKNAFTGTNTVYYRIQKLNGTYYLYYKFTENGKYIQLTKFNDFYKIFNNGTLGLNFVNNYPNITLNITGYKVGTSKQ